MTVDIFDSVVKILDIVLNEKWQNYGIPKRSGAGRIALAYMSLLLRSHRNGGNKMYSSILKHFPKQQFRHCIFLGRLSRDCIKNYKKDDSFSNSSQGTGSE